MTSEDKEKFGELYYGFYSPSLDKQSGHCVYSSVDGKYVAVTQVCEGPVPFLPQYDEVFVGMVKDFVRRNDNGEMVTVVSSKNGTLVSSAEINAEPVPDIIVLNRGK